MPTMTTDVVSEVQTANARDLIERETFPAMPGTPKTIMIIVRSRLMGYGVFWNVLDRRLFRIVKQSLTSLSLLKQCRHPTCF